MTPRPESPPTIGSQDPLIDPQDIVATQGAYLVSPPRTPVWRRCIDEDFVAKLEACLQGVIVGQNCRRAMYREAADEWRMGHTPPEIKERRKAELKAYDELEGVTSEDDSDNEDKGRVKFNPNDKFPTPPRSDEGAHVTPHRRKRRKLTEETEEEHRPTTKKHISTIRQVSVDAEDGMFNIAQQPSSRKRPRTLDKGDKEHGDKQRPRKVRATMARSRGIWLRRLRPRPVRPNG